MRRFRPSECRINLGLAGQLSEHSLADALIGIKFAVTQSSSDWGHESAPKRFYLTAFAFVDTDMVPLIGPDVDRSTVTLSRTQLPDKTETFFNEEIVTDASVVGVWEASTAAQNKKLINLVLGALGRHRISAEVEMGNNELLNRIQTDLGMYLMYRDLSTTRMGVLRANVYKMDSKEDTKRSPELNAGLKTLATEHMSLRKINTRINELERTYDLHSRHLGLRAQTIPTGISLIVVQVDTSKLKENDIPGFILPSMVEAPQTAAPVVKTPEGVEVHVQVEIEGKPPVDIAGATSGTENI